MFELFFFTFANLSDETGFDNIRSETEKKVSQFILKSLPSIYNTSSEFGKLSNEIDVIKLLLKNFDK